MIKRLLKKLALKYTNLTYPVATDMVTMAGLTQYTELYELITGEEIGEIEMCEESFEQYDHILVGSVHVRGEDNQELTFNGIKVIKK